MRMRRILLAAMAAGLAVCFAGCIKIRVTVKMNEDGSFNLHMGATDLGTGSDTVLAQIAAEVLGVAVTDIIVLSSDTDLTPFDVGAYASSTTFISGNAVKKAALHAREQILAQFDLLDHHLHLLRGGRLHLKGDAQVWKDPRVFGPPHIGSGRLSAGRRLTNCRASDHRAKEQ